MCNILYFRAKTFKQLRFSLLSDNTNKKLNYFAISIQQPLQN